MISVFWKSEASSPPASRVRLISGRLERSQLGAKTVAVRALYKEAVFVRGEWPPGKPCESSSGLVWISVPWRGRDRGARSQSSSRTAEWHEVALLPGFARTTTEGRWRKRKARLPFQGALVAPAASGQPSRLGSRKIP